MISYRSAITTTPNTLSTISSYIIYIYLNSSIIQSYQGPNKSLWHIHVHETQKRTFIKVLKNDQFFVAMILSNASPCLVSQIGMPLNHETFEVWCANVEALVNIQLDIVQHWTLFYQVYCANSVRWNVSCSLKSTITKSYALVENDQIIKWEEFVKFGEKKMDKQVSAHLLVGLFTVVWLIEAKRLEEVKWIIPKLCAFAVLSILQISVNVGRFRGSHSQHLVMQ